ncbi:uncharacterized protein LOC143464890 [Clavelina lepadiformis]|uniref:Uncharacterized protein n=1 Tax=Clavelina lepadiformis TaxID=159417 RepID=A0ABP0EWK5_CLALP
MQTASSARFAEATTTAVTNGAIGYHRTLVIVAALLSLLFGGFVVCYIVRRYRLKIQNTMKANTKICVSEPDAALNENESIPTQCSSENAVNHINQFSTPSSQNEHFSESKIGPAGGILKCDCFTVEFPPGSLAKVTNIRLQTLPGKDIYHDDKNFFAISKALRCQPAGLEFRKPCTITADTCYRPVSDSPPVSLTVFVRENGEKDAWQKLKGSNCSLTKDKKFSFKLKHFSDYVAQPETAQSSNLRKDLISVGFEEHLSDKEKSITWYVMDSNETFSKINPLHGGKIIIPYETFSMSLGDDFYLNLQCNGQSNRPSPCVVIDREHVLIRAGQVRSIEVAISNNFLVMQTTNSDRTMTFHYSVTKHSAAPATSTDNRPALWGRFYFTMRGRRSNNRSETQTNYNIQSQSTHMIVGSNGSINAASTPNMSPHNCRLQGGPGSQSAPEIPVMREIRGRPASRYQQMSSCSTSTDVSSASDRRSASSELFQSPNYRLSSDCQYPPSCTRQSVKSKIRRFEPTRETQETAPKTAYNGSVHSRLEHRTMQDREVNALNNSSEMEESTRDSEQHLLSDVESRSDSDSDDYQKTVHSSLV